jgi:hypothetical protein
MFQVLKSVLCEDLTGGRSHYNCYTVALLYIRVKAQLYAFKQLSRIIRWSESVWSCAGARNLVPFEHSPPG